MRAICGLGNPGRRYRRTRHNLGFLALDRYLARYWPRRVRPRSQGIPFPPLPLPRWRRALPEALLCRPTPELVLLKPLTYMNRSGVAIARLLDRFALEPKDCLIVYDDVALPLGELRARARGGAGGHKGMASVIEALGTTAIPRLRLGIDGEEKPDDLVRFVLSEFTSEEWPRVEGMLDRAAAALDRFHHGGIAGVLDFLAQLKQRSAGSAGGEREQEQGQE